MMRPLYAVSGALVLVLLWVGIVLYQTNGDLPAAVQALADGAQRVSLPGLAAKGYLYSAALERGRLEGLDHRRPEAKPVIERIMARRMAAARVLLAAGQTEAAERIALEGARADFDDLPARALLLETRLRGEQADAARRELMLLVLRREHPELLCLLGRTFARDSRPDDAMAFYQRALALDPQHVPSLLGMAHASISKHDRAGALRWLQAADEAAERPDQRQAVAAVRRRVQPGGTVTLPQALAQAREYLVPLLFLLAYLLFLFSPALYGLLRRGDATADGADAPEQELAASA